MQPTLVSRIITTIGDNVMSPSQIVNKLSASDSSVKYASVNTTLATSRNFVRVGYGKYKLSSSVKKTMQKPFPVC